VDRIMPKSISSDRSPAKPPVQRYEPMPEKGAKFEPFYVAGFGDMERRSPLLPRRFDRKR
jgi:hypothetical protein